MGTMSTASPTANPRAGRYLLAHDGPDGFWAFHPAALPPYPPLRVGADLQTLSDRANQALGRLDGITMLLPDPNQFIHSFARKEAVLSSQIEGTRSSLSDLLLFEQAGTPSVSREDAEEAANYIAAMDHGLTAIQRRGAPPLSARLLRDVHGILLRSGRGSEKAPGEFRRSQNWIGGTRPRTARFVPPPWPESFRRWVRWSVISTTIRSRRPSSRRLLSPTCSSRRSIRSSTATGASVAC